MSDHPKGLHLVESFELLLNADNDVGGYGNAGLGGRRTGLGGFGRGSTSGLGGLGGYGAGGTSGLGGRPGLGGLGNRGPQTALGGINKSGLGGLMIAKE